MDTIRILLIDRHDEWLEFAAGVLRQVGYRVTLSTDLDQACQLGASSDFELILLGLDYLERHRAMLSHLANRPVHPWRFVVLFPIHQTYEQVRMAFKMGAFDVVDKPYQREALLKMVAAQLSDIISRSELVTTINTNGVK